MIQYREHMRGMQCQQPGCKHTSHDKGVFLNQRCHRGAGALAAIRGGVLVIECAACSRDVASIAVEGSDSHLSAACHPLRPVEVYYVDDTVRISCAVCHTVIDTRDVRGRPPSVAFSTAPQ